MPKIPGSDKQQYLANLREGDTHAVAARKSGHPRTSYARIAEKDEAFKASIAEAANEGVDALEQKLVRYGLGLDPIKNASQVTALFGVLKARDPKRWVEKNQIDLGNADGKPLQVEGVGVSIREILEFYRKIGAGSKEGNAGHREGVPSAGEVLPAGDK